jgi:hypothetical protein
MSGASDSLDGRWIGQFLEQLGEVIDKAKRVHFKSLGGILALQEKVAKVWSLEQMTPGGTRSTMAAEQVGTITEEQAIVAN